uniref:Uncharacterized protein n=2 Tax=Rhodnius prolixus TaxID=13249 RepID=T1I0P0_RHOPR
MSSKQAKPKVLYFLRLLFAWALLNTKSEEVKVLS